MPERMQRPSSIEISITTLHDGTRKSNDRRKEPPLRRIPQQVIGNGWHSCFGADNGGANHSSRQKESAETWPSSVSHKHVMVPLHYPVDGRLKSLIVAIRDRRVILRGNEIQWLRAKRNYVTIQTSYEQFRVRETMMSIQKRIAPPLIRVHRSAIVNLDFIVE